MKPLSRGLVFLLLVWTSALLGGCGHRTAATALPPVASAARASNGANAAALGSRRAKDVVLSQIAAIDVGGGAVGGFAADPQPVPATSSASSARSVASVVAGVYSTGAPITVAVPNAAPAAIYQTQRYGPMTYAIPHLTPNASYVVRLHFAELYYGVAGRPGRQARLFNAFINGTRVLTNYDVFESAGAANTAVVDDFDATADANGTITVVLTAGDSDWPELNGIEVLQAGAVAATAIDVGGPAVAPFVADADRLGGRLFATTDPIVTSAPNAAPAAVYQTQAYGNMTFLIPGFTPGAPYTLRLHFAELYYGLAGRPGVGARQFNVDVNGVRALTNFDTVAAAGGADVAVVQTIATTADAAGQIALAFSPGAADSPIVNAIEVLPATSSLAMNVGGGAVGAFAAEHGTTGGTPFGTAASINVSAANAAPMAVYQTQRYRPFSVTLNGLAANGPYTLRMHFAELYWGLAGRPGVGARQFNVVVNGAPVLTNFDVFAAAGGPNTAVVRDVPVTADPSGTVTIALTNGAADLPILGGVELIPNPGFSAGSAAVDWPTYGFDLQRTGYNPNESVLSPTSAKGLKLKWTAPIGAVDASPVLAAGVRVNGVPTDVVYVGTETGGFYAIDAHTGATIWSKTIGFTNDPINCGNYTVGITGAAAIDRASNRVYVAAGPPSGNAVYAYDLATGAAAPGWPVVVSNAPAAEHIYASLTFNPVSHLLYVPIGSYCDGQPWTGKLVAVDAARAAIVGAFQPVTTPGSYGGGIWGAGGASIDPSGNLYVTTGNALPAEQTDFAEEIVRLDPALHPTASNYPGLSGGDVDFGATPMLFTPPSCPAKTVVLNKTGALFEYDRDAIGAGARQRLQIGRIDANGTNVGVAAYAPPTNMVYVANATDSSSGGYGRGLLAFSIAGDCTLALAWQQTLGYGVGDDNPYASPSVAGGLVFFGTGNEGKVYALDAKTGAIVWSTYVGSNVFSTPIAVNGTVFVGASTWAGTGVTGGLYAYGL